MKHAFQFFSDARARCRTAWSNATVSQQLAFAAAGALLVLLATTFLLVIPALSTLQNAAVRHRALDAQLLEMRSLAAEARTLQKLPRARLEESRQALELAVKQHLGKNAALVLAGNRATVSFKAVSAPAIASFLSQTRLNAKTLPVEAALVANNEPNPAWGALWLFALPQP